MGFFHFFIAVAAEDGSEKLPPILETTKTITHFAKAPH